MEECIKKEAVDVYIVMKYMDCDLQRALSCGILVKTHKDHIFAQILKSVLFLHQKGTMHRDIKPSNILINSNCEVRLADFGMARSTSYFENIEYGSSTEFTDYVTSRWYRAPEILLGSSHYNEKIDIWALGCVLGELFLGRPLFEGSSSLDQLIKIFTYIDRPCDMTLKEINSGLSLTILSALSKSHKKNLDDLFQGVNPDGIDLIKRMLEINPNDRISAKQAIKHPFIA